MNNNLEKFKPAVSESTKRKGRRGGLTVVNAETGKRVAINSSISGELELIEKVQLAFSEDEIAIGRSLPNNENWFNLKKSGCIYSAELVREITDIYGLDFKNKTSITFEEVRYEDVDGYKVALIKVS